MIKCLRPTVATVSLGAIKDNFNLLRKLAAPAGLCAVVKADAYGHGVSAVAPMLERAGCTHFAVSSLDEGLCLRELGIEGEVLALFGVDPVHSSLVAEAGITPLVPGLSMLKGFSEASASFSRPMGIHLNFDTGMGRIGLKRSDIAEAADILRNSPNLKVKGVATHFARAGQDSGYTRSQIDVFDGILAALESHSISTGLVHAANSAACMAEPNARYGCVRTGIALYGGKPEEGLKGAEDLKPALSWSTSIEHLRRVEAGTPLSYGGSFVTARPSMIAAIPVGYADGFSRANSNMVGSALVGGVKVPVVGKVCMDITLLDVTDVESVAVGDEVVLLGRQGDREISAEEAAKTLSTINYEILCGIGKRVPRQYI